MRYLGHHPYLRLSRSLDGDHSEVLPDTLSPVPVLSEDLLLCLGGTDMPREARAPIIPLSKSNLAPGIERDDVKHVHRVCGRFSLLHTIRNALHLLEKVRRKPIDPGPELLRDCAYVLPVELARLFEELAVDRELVQDLGCEKLAMLQPYLYIVIVSDLRSEGIAGTLRCSPRTKIP